MDEMIEMMKETMVEIKEIMVEIKEIKNGNKEFREVIKTLQEEYKKVKEENSKLREEITSIKTKIEWLETSESQIEKVEKAKRKNNILISGIKIDSNDDMQAIKKVEEFISRNINVNTKLKKIEKINNNMWNVEIENFEKKMEIMKNKTRLRGGINKNVYIRNDLTEQERKIQNKIKEAAEQEKIKNEKCRVKIGYQKLSIDGVNWIWDNRRKELILKDDANSKNWKK